MTALDGVQALAKEASTIPTWSSPPTDANEADWRNGYAAAMADFADRLSHVLTTGAANSKLVADQ